MSDNFSTVFFALISWKIEIPMFMMMITKNAKFVIAPTQMRATAKIKQIRLKNVQRFFATIENVERYLNKQQVK